MKSQKDQTIEQIFHLGLEVAEKVIRSIKSIKGTVDELPYKFAVHFFFCKAYKTYQAIHLLCHNKFNEDAIILCRTIFEWGYNHVTL
jgi:hypothetical protein